MSIIYDLSIIVLAKNEHDNLVLNLPKLKKLSTDVILIDGNSTDNTNNLCAKLGINFFLDDGKGKGSAQRLGYSKAKHNYLIFYDGDGSPNIKDIPKIHRLLKKNNLVICSRQTGGSYDLNFNSGFKSAIRASGCIFLTSLFNNLYKTSFTDVLYSFKGIDKKYFKLLNTKANGFSIELDILINAILNQYKIIEIPSRENSRKYGKSKLPTIVGLYFIYFILKKYFLSLVSKSSIHNLKL